MNIESLKQFKGLEFSIKKAEAYARIRLGLDDAWIVYAWSSLMEHINLPKEEEYYNNLDGADRLQEIISDVVHEATDAHQLPKHQMYVKLVKAKTIEEARENWRNKANMDRVVCLIDWALVQAL